MRAIRQSTRLSGSTGVPLVEQALPAELISMSAGLCHATMEACVRKTPAAVIRVHVQLHTLAKPTVAKAVLCWAARASADLIVRWSSMNVRRCHVRRDQRVKIV